MVVTEEVRLQRAVGYLLRTVYSGGEIRWRASGVRLPASCLVRLLDCKRDVPVQSTNGQARRSASSHVSSSPACLTPLIYNGLFLVTLNAMTLFPNLRRLQARNVCLRCSRVSNRPCRNGYPVFLNPYTMLVHFVIHLHLTGGYLCINEKEEAIGNRAILIERSTVLTRLSPNHHTLMYSHPSKTT